LPAIKRNLALREAVGDFVLFINDDLWVGPQFLSAHASAHEEHPGAVAVLGLVEQSARMPSTPFVDWYQPFAYHELEGRECESLPWSYFWSMNISLPRGEMIDRNLVFHTDWSEIGHEDVELGYRWVRAGNSIVFHPEARGEHYHPHSLDSACNLQFTIGRGLRDLEQLVLEPMLLERYGVFSWHGSRRAMLRGLARMTLFNGLTVPAAKRWLESRTTYGPLARWMNWKVMLHYTNRGYRSAPQSSTVPLTTDPRGSRLGDE
jgi:GT2 family glycosyltransferase